jgi:ubiquilin
MMRNPNAMREAMRSQDLAMSQLENIPGGFNALRRMYEDVQEPIADMSANLQNRESQTMGSSSSVPLATPNTSALPNPWGAATSGTSLPNPWSSQISGSGSLVLNLVSLYYYS